MLKERGRCRSGMSMSSRELQSGLSAASARSATALSKYYEALALHLRADVGSLGM